ncbi:PQQ-dependent sugar dehydrogenase [Pontibacter sp. E15-1]|uniref:PQQ-dependent sugar dehydrogenase n=1 Tax=Pontibacter sp. E15-1 TaxID=2919918 RepID=UPI001F4F2C5F|nr:PQQ-dependent sugar dehydrogenase [Pontibacter sp. E15-1]MCJ8166491.1 PQQ-dependent sugar dehydrogenase [Pontibacter sp. E15-1]
MKTNSTKQNDAKVLPHGRNLFGRWMYLPLLFMLYAVTLSGCRDKDDGEVEFSTLQVPDGYKVEKVARGLNLPTSVTWDDAGNMYVVEAGGGLEPEKRASMRILQVKHGKTTEVVDLAGKGIQNSVVGLTWYDGAFYITHRADDLTGAVSRVTKDGQVQTLFKGIIDSQAEHQINDIRMGPDGRMYVAVGPAGNAGVIDMSVAPWVMKSPDVHAVPCQDIVLVGSNFKTPDFRTEDPGDTVLTGAFLPFGTPSTPGQVIKGMTLCGGSILSFDPHNPMGTLETHAWGFRNLIGLAWDKKTGAMYAAENGYDVRGSRPVNDDVDASLRIEKGKWYGIPDFSAGREPLTNAKFEVPDSLQAMVVVNGQPQGKNLGFVIDHQASGLTPPDPSVVLGKHEVNSSPSMMDVAPDSWGSMAGHVFVAEWGDLAPPTNPLRGKAAAGSQVVMIDPATGQLHPFIRNMQPGPASMQGPEGSGIERPFGLRFGPDGAMYIVDYGVVKIDMSRRPPYAYQPGTGVIWKVTRK